MPNFTRLVDKSDCLTGAPIKTEGELYWQKFKSRKKYCLKSRISSIEFSRLDPASCEAGTAGHNLVVTSGVHTTLYDSFSLAPLKRYARFTSEVLTASVRKNGNLLAAAGKDNLVKVFDPDTKDLLRVLKGHAGHVRKVAFCARSLTSLASFSSDRSVRSWDIPGEKCLLVLKDAHSGPVSCGEQNPRHASQWFSAGADGAARLWDFRRAGPAALEIAAGFPVESIQLVPDDDSLLFAAGGTFVAAFDVRAGHKELHRWDAHHGLVTGLAFDGGRGELVSCSLDHSVKMFDVATFSVTFQKRFSAPLTAVALSETNDQMAVGDANGDVHFMSRAAIGGSGDSFPVGTKQPRALDTNFAAASVGKNNALPGEHGAVVIASTKRRRKFAVYDDYLRSFRYKSAVDSVLASTAAPVDLVAALFRELIERGALLTALAGRDDKSLGPVLKFVTRHITAPGHSVLMASVAWALTELYEDVAGDWEASGRLFAALLRKVDSEVSLQRELLGFEGALEAIRDSRF